MKIQRRSILVIIFSVAAIFAVLAFFHKKAVVISQQTFATNAPRSLIETSITSIKAISNQTPNDLSSAANKTDESYIKLFQEETRKNKDFEWKQPINFWGRVVDESNEPIVGANVHFEWSVIANDLNTNGTSEAATKSDDNGFFSLIGSQGKRLFVDVSKEGYYPTDDSRNATFEYANPYQGLFIPDQNNPVVFHLRTKGVGVDLITSQYGVKKYLSVTVPLDGKPTDVNLLERKSGGQGQLILSQIKPESANWQQATNWTFKMEIPNGGFIEESDEFPFEAPEGGYQPAVEFQFQKRDTDWMTNLKTDYYIEFGNPPHYGYLHLDTSIMMGGARLTYAINPSGARNLEPKQ